MKFYGANSKAGSEVRVKAPHKFMASGVTINLGSAASVTVTFGGSPLTVTRDGDLPISAPIRCVGAVTIQSTTDDARILIVAEDECP